MKKIFGMALLALATSGMAADLPDGNALMQKVYERDEGVTQISNINFNLTDKRGKTREQQTIAYRKWYGKEKRQVIFYQEPTNVRGTGFLTFDYPEADKDDDQWLYLPAVRKVRRISASDRGDYFLGTDLTYEDIKRAGKISLDDYDFTATGREAVDGIDAVIVEATPKSKDIMKELGYSKGIHFVNEANNTVLKSQIWDVKGNEFKTIVFDDIRQVDGIWTTHVIDVTNHKTRHHTKLTISNVDYQTPIDEDVFTQGTLRRGL